MLAMGGQGPGYMHTVIITPYMHSLIYHVPVMLKRHGSLQKFSGQGIYLFNFSKKIRYSGTQPYRHLVNMDTWHVILCRPKQIMH